MAGRQHEFDFAVRGGVGATVSEWQRQIKFIKPAKQGRIAVVLLSEKYFACFVHFVEGRTIACTATNCKWCAKGRRARWRYFVEAQTILTKTRGIIELGQRAGKVLEELLAERGTLRGVMAVLERKGESENAQIVLTNITTAETNGLPSESDWLGLLLSMWHAQIARGDENE